VIEPRFDWTGYFSQGQAKACYTEVIDRGLMAPIEFQLWCGIIDKTGKYITTPQREN